MIYTEEQRALRNSLVNRYYEIEQQLYPEDDDEPDDETAARLQERLYLTLGEYSDILPRVRLSVCPFCKTPLKRAFDPFGLDGLWWHSTQQILYEEPATCDHFKVLLGALSLHGRAPVEATSQVLPGPDVPFVVPRLVSLPGMIAVIGNVQLETKDDAYTVAYFSDQPIRHSQLHQPWCREAYWYADESGSALWYTANDEFDFELKPHIDSGRVRWVHLDNEQDRVFGPADEECPFVGIQGDRERQQIVVGERDLIGLPDGSVVNPFEE